MVVNQSATQPSKWKGTKASTHTGAMITRKGNSNKLIIQTKSLAWHMRE